MQHKILAPGDLVEILEGPFSQRKGEVSKVRDGELKYRSIEIYTFNEVICIFIVLKSSLSPEPPSLGDKCLCMTVSCLSL